MDNWPVQLRLSSAHDSSPRDQSLADLYEDIPARFNCGFPKKVRLEFCRFSSSVAPWLSCRVHGTVSLPSHLFDLCIFRRNGKLHNHHWSNHRSFSKEIYCCAVS
jgi:hypothetical protein